MREDFSRMPAGTITKIEPGGITVATGSHDIVLRKLRAISGKDLAILDAVGKFGLFEGLQLKDLDPTTTERITAFNAAVARHEAFWVERLETSAPVTLTHAVRSVSRDSNVTRCASLSIPLPVEIVSLLHERSRMEKPDELLLTAFAAYLARIGGVECFDIGFSEPALRREVAGLEEVFATQIPLRLKIPHLASLEEALPAVRRELELVRGHRTYARDTLCRYPALHSASASLQGNLLPVSVWFADGVNELVAIPESEFTLVLPKDCEALRAVYSTAAFDAEAVTRILGQFNTFLVALVADPSRPVAELSLLSAAERHRLLVEWNDTAVEYPRDRLMHQVFEEQAARTPDAVALVHGNKTFSYGELEARSNQLAHHLIARGVRPDSRVAICMDRSLDMVVAMLGTLKAGGAYVPLDPVYPADRLSHMLTDSEPVAVLTRARWKEALPATLIPVIALDADWPTIGGEAIEPPDAATLGLTPEHIAYVIYTSGSTGMPKGVLLLHRGICNHLHWMADVLGINSSDRFLQKTSISFDASIVEIFAPLRAGGSVVLAQADGEFDTGYLVEAIQENEITILQMVPSALKVLLLDPAFRSCRGLRYLICGGEALERELAREVQVQLPGVTLGNFYGPTETSIDATWHLLKTLAEGPGTVPIGRPVANVRCYVLDRHLQPVPVGIVGQLYVSGAGLARGYLHRPELTRECFVADPFRAGERMYATGDLVRYLPGGEIEYVGRSNQQIKIRGYRVELGEIEARLAALPGVTQCVVIAREDFAGDKRLVAYIVPQADMPAAEVLRERLRLSLPEHMVPQRFVRLGGIPLLPSGKIDYKHLPAPEWGLPAEGPAFVPPRNAIETTLAGIWKEVFGLEQVGAHDDFFELGGHSLLAIRIVAKVSSVLKVVMPLHWLFVAPTVAGLAQKLSGVTGMRPTGDSGVPAEISERRAPQSATERRLLAIWKRMGGEDVVNIRDSLIALQGPANRVDRLLAELSAEFGVFVEGFPVSKFFERPTIEALARIIDAGIEPPSQLLVCLQPRGSQRPLFLIHAGGGYVFFYRALAMRLGSDRPVYGVRAETRLNGLGSLVERNKRVETLAARYIAEIKTVQARGPYSLGGACIGGVIAFEMARQLRAQGDEVADPVLLFDSFIDNNLHSDSVNRPALRSHLEYLQRRFVSHLDRSSQMGGLAGLQYLLRKVLGNALKIFSILPGLIRAQALKPWLVLSDLAHAIRYKLGRLCGKEVQAEQFQKWIMDQFMSRALQLLRRYIPGVYEGQIVLFKAQTGEDTSSMWTGLARGGMVVHELPGEHLHMLEEPTVVRTATLVRKYLQWDPEPREGTWRREARQWREELNAAGSDPKPLGRAPGVDPGQAGI